MEKKKKRDTSGGGKEVVRFVKRGEESHRSFSMCVKPGPFKHRRMRGGKETTKGKSAEILSTKKKKGEKKGGRNFHEHVTPLRRKNSCLHSKTVGIVTLQEAQMGLLGHKKRERVLAHHRERGVKAS